MNIRKATIDDLDGLVDLNKQIGEFHFENAPSVFCKPSEEERGFLLKALNDQERLFLVSTIDKKVTGFLTATISQNEVIPFLSKEPICRVGTIVIDQYHRDSGLGNNLMLECKKWALSSGAKEIRLEVMEFNDKALGFYKNLGFHTQSKIMSQSICG
ncbi:MAG: N-acetyltransferase [Moritella sp.]|uniref:GNAT family N-acetyltransferase n=1 Tax=unclassified Moritella TaxID=2637987 RepID=UPI0001568C8D|nr:MULTISPECIES: N-acetyltransferase [unclassified Moritella]EDM65707.1 putative acetyltransferase [Moritella sp. PE36]MBL1417871.1 GNAT family N-acetyltransferase [Moritella sp.]PHR89596.1 MAG: N-acetyltransferase [Moritella sp.]